MKLPRAQIERMLRDGPAGEVTSMICLGAAIAVKRGEPVGSVEVSALPWKEELPASRRAALKDVLNRAHESFLHATPEEIDCAIALYTEHLKAAGYQVEMGYDH